MTLIISLNHPRVYTTCTTPFIMTQTSQSTLVILVFTCISVINTNIAAFYLKFIILKILLDFLQFQKQFISKCIQIGAECIGWKWKVLDVDVNVMCCLQCWLLSCFHCRLPDAQCKREGSQRQAKKTTLRFMLVSLSVCLSRCFGHVPYYLPHPSCDFQNAVFKCLRPQHDSRKRWVRARRIRKLCSIGMPGASAQRLIQMWFEIGWFSWKFRLNFILYD